MTMTACSGFHAKGAPERLAGMLSKPDIEGRHQPKAADREPPLRCAACLEPVATGKDRIAVDGSHAHVFANPCGIVFEIGCFALAPGCGTVGEASDEFTWFPGYAWQIGVCGNCARHLGWRFASDGGNFFWALILDRLV
ncbi:cereblon family protein [Desulfatirhabdium butyrativorans]|uniref:cereblon family protein n=1 Tax=Desulfatirhabdium butyrativorans TaxID=340467 RepID=UPI0003FD6CC4|nr:cereblon family protein [Desulfatirhabdium butyrativorans]